MKPVETFIQRLFQARIKEAAEIDPVYAELLRQIANLVERGGKRMRPELVLQAYAAYDGDSKAIISVAASQELFHAFILMHDDIIDRDTMRWGGNNISGHYQAAFSKHLAAADAGHYANAWALLAGDICHNLSHQTLLSSDFPADDILRAAAITHQTTFQVVGGELADTALPIFSQPDTIIDDKQLLKISRTKTANYSFSTPLQLGALFAGATRSQLNQLQRFGDQLGVAFQLRDDLLGVFGDQQTLGKSTLTDLQEGKRTLLMSYGLELAGASDRQLLLSALGSSTATTKQLAQVQHILVSSGARKKTEAVMEDYCQAARTVLLEATVPSQLDHYLKKLIVFCSQRVQ